MWALLGFGFIFHWFCICCPIYFAIEWWPPCNLNIERTLISSILCCNKRGDHLIILPLISEDSNTNSNGQGNFQEDFMKQLESLLTPGSILVIALLLSSFSFNPREQQAVSITWNILQGSLLFSICYVSYKLSYSLFQVIIGKNLDFFFTHLVGNYCLITLFMELSDSLFTMSGEKGGKQWTRFENKTQIMYHVHTIVYWVDVDLPLYMYSYCVNLIFLFLLVMSILL